MRFTRRDFLRSAGAAAAVAGLGCRGLGREGPAAPVFQHGVASGDPLADRVILWTRITAPPLSRVPVRWRIAKDPELREVVGYGAVAAGPEADHTVKVDAEGLAPGRTWYFDFESQGQRSPVGRTRTLPVGAVERLRLAVCSCSNHPQGFFNGYAAMARRDDLDAVVHLGDYIYEYGEGGYGWEEGLALGRVPDPPREVVSLADYRRRHAQYKADPDLQEAHRRHPFLAVWDDHESANNAWKDGAQNHDASEGDWAARKTAAVRAYHEWMPTRRTGPLYRSFRYGDLADLLLLDTRLERDAQAARDDAAAIAEPGRSLLGAEQEAWLEQQLSASQADGVAWRVLGQQVFLGHLALPGAAPNPDAWDGYPASRERLFDHVESAGIRDLVVLTGDVHSSWALDVARDPFSPDAYDPATGRGALAVELVAPAVSSSVLGSFPGLRAKYRDAVSTHPHLHFMDLDHRGYVVVDVSHERTRAEWWFLETVKQRSLAERLGAAFVTRRGASHLVPATV